MDAKDLVSDALDQRGAAYHDKLTLCRDEFSKGNVHNLRTSIRRLLATLDVIAFVTSASRSEKLVHRLKEQLDGFSDLRDIQVMRDKISEDIDKFPELEPLQDRLKKQEKRRQRSGEKHLERIKLGNINQRLLEIQEAVEDLSADEWHTRLPQAVDEAYLTVIQRYSEIDPAQLTSIHRLRVAFKKFRYMMEAIYPCLPEFPESQLEEMHDYQTQMGDLHDTQIFLETLAEFYEGDDSYDLQPVRRFYEQSLADELSGYLMNKDKVLHFWRATPLVAFPWQRVQEKKGKQI